MATPVLVPVRTGPVFSLPGMFAVAGPMAGTPVRGAMAYAPHPGVNFPSGNTAIMAPPTPGRVALNQRLAVRAAAQRDGANNVAFPLRLNADLGPTALVATVVALETDANGAERIVERQVTVEQRQDASGLSFVEVPANAVALALTSRNGPVPVPWTALVNEWRVLPGPGPGAPATAQQVDPTSPARLSDAFMQQVSGGGTFLQRHGKTLLVGGLAAALVAGVVVYSRRKGSDAPRDNPGCGCGPSCGCGPCREKHHGKDKR